jgi:hypothetical protein
MLNYHQFAAKRLAEFTQPFGPPGIPPPALDRFLSIHDHTRQPPDRGRIGRWRTEMPETQQRQYEAIAGDLLRQLGYPTRFCGAV